MNEIFEGIYIYICVYIYIYVCISTCNLLSDIIVVFPVPWNLRSVDDDWDIFPLSRGPSSN